jgi:hypothetical protein
MPARFRKHFWSAYASLASRLERQALEMSLACLGLRAIELLRPIVAPAGLIQTARSPFKFFPTAVEGASRILFAAPQWPFETPFVAAR